MTDDIKQAVRELREWLDEKSGACFLHAPVRRSYCGNCKRTCDPFSHLPAVLDRLEELERENSKLTNARNYYEEVWKESCAHVGEACKILGVDPKETPADTWTLREAAAQMVAERDAALSRVAELDSKVTFLEFGTAAENLLTRFPALDSSGDETEDGREG